MKKIAAVVIIAILMILGLTSLQAYAQPAFDSKTPGAKETEQASEKATEQAGEAAEKAKTKAEDQGGQKHNYKGTLVSITAASITIKLEDGTQKTFAITNATKVKIPGAGNGYGNGKGKGNGNGKKAPSTSDLQTGAKVMVQASGTPETARHFMVFPGKPATSHHVGNVTQYTPGKSLAILSQDGQTSTFALTAQTKIQPEERAGELKVGSRVTVIYGHNASGDAPEVRGIVVHPAGSGPKETETQKP